jgi:hypothetical protein
MILPLRAGMSIRIALLLSVISIVSSAQEYWQITGIVTNSETLEPLPYANIRILNKSLGTISNQQGRFIIRLPVEFRSDTLTFSYLGFKKQILPLDKVRTDSIIISLQPEIYKLKEVTAQGMTAMGLLQKCLEQISENYPAQSVGMTAFYRETIRENSQPVQIVEAVLGIDKQPYVNDKKRDRMVLLKGRQNGDVYESRIWEFINFVDGPYEALESDVCKYPDDFITLPRTRFNFLNPKHSRYYDYSFMEVPESAEDKYYLIRFYPPAGEKKAVLEGEIYIDKLSLAIIRIDYRINPYHIKRTSVVDIYTESELNKLDIYTQTNSFDCSVNYRLLNGKWFLDYVRINYNFHLLWLNDQYLAQIDNTIQFVVTDFSLDQSFSARYGKLIKRKFPLPQQLGEPDDSFWENYNYILREKIPK